MEYYDHDDGVAGSIPEFGAIFMSSNVTKNECFRRKIFGLPSSKSEFVKHVKSGMVLFLFESKKRQLFGVFQATSDGAMNIVPNAFNYSGRRFPAQVCFTTIWYCDPLSEREFQDAIFENYFSAKKFNFGLSEDQVHRLLCLFSSRKIKKEIVPQPLTESVIGVAGKGRRSADDDIFELGERGYKERTENEKFIPAVFSEYHVNSSFKEDELLSDYKVNTEGKISPSFRGDFLSKRRIIDTGDRLFTNDVADIYNNYGALRTSYNNSPKDSLVELRKLATVRKLLTAERVRKENQVNKIRHAILSSESVMDPLDVRTADDDRFMQRNRLFNDYNMDNDSASELYEKSFDTSNHAIDDSFLFDDYVQRNQNLSDIVEPMICSDGNLNSCSEAMQVIEDHQCNLSRKLKNRCHLDCGVSPFSSFEHNDSLLHKTRKAASGVRFPVNDRMECEPNFVEHLSSVKFSRPLHCDHRNIYDRRYRVAEGRVNENMVDNTSYSATTTRNTGYFGGVCGQVVDEGRFRESEAVENPNDINRCFGMDISSGPSAFYPNRTLSSFSDKLLPGNGPSQLHAAYKFGPSGPTFDDPTITRPTPYSPEHPHLSHGLNAPIAANQNSRLKREDPHHGFLEDYYSCKNMSPPCNLESEKTSRFSDIPPELGNRCVPTKVSSIHQSSLGCESTSSFRNSDLSMNLNTSGPVNHRGSLFSKSMLARHATDLENIEEEEGALFDYLSKSSGDHFAFDENLATASQHTSKHVLQQETDISGKDFSFSEAKDSTLDMYNRKRDRTGYRNQYFEIASNVNCPVNHDISGSPHSFSNVNRKSVFSRLTSGEEFQGGGERNHESEFDFHDCYMDATADAVMEMLRHSNNPSLRKLKKSRLVGQSRQGESTSNEKQVRSHIDTKSSAVVNNEKHVRSHVDTKSSAVVNKKVKDAHPATIEQSIDQVQKETRMMDYKFHSETKKNSIEGSTDSATRNKITGAHEDFGNSKKTTLKRRRLVRPVFGKMEPATDNICSNKKRAQFPAQTLGNDDEQNNVKAVSLCETEMPVDITGSNDMSVSHTQSMNCDRGGPPSFEKQNDISVCLFPSTRTELEENKTSIVCVPIDKRDCVKAICTSEAETSSDDSRLNDVLASGPSTRTELKENKTSIVHDPIEKRDCVKAICTSEAEISSYDTRVNDVLVSGTHQSMDCNTKEHLNHEKQKGISVHVFPSSDTELKEHETSNLGVDIDKRDCEKAVVSLCEAEMPIDIIGSNDMSVSHTHQSMNCSFGHQKDIAVCLFPSIRTELKENETSLVDVPVEKRDCVKCVRTSEVEISNNDTRLNDALVSHTHQSMDCNTKEHLCLEEQKGISVHVFPSSDTELKKHETSILGVYIDRRNCQKADSICESETINGDDDVHTHPSMNCNTEEHPSSKEQNDIVVHLLPSSSTELKEQETSIIGLHIDSSQARATETTQHKSVEGILFENVDSTTRSLNLEVSSSVGLEFAAGCLNNVTEEKRQRLVKRKNKIIKKIMKKVAKINKTCTGGPSE